MSKSCIFCTITESNNSLFQHDHFYGVWDIDPIQKGHLLIMSKRHIMNISEMSDDELQSMAQLQKDLVTLYEANADILGITTIYNNGSVMMDGTHFHFHLIPRYKNDQFFDAIKPIQYKLDTSQFEEALKQF